MAASGQRHVKEIQEEEMTKHDKEVILAKIDALRWSFADTQLQALAGILYDVAGLMPVDGKEELGFSAHRTVPPVVVKREQA